MPEIDVIVAGAGPNGLMLARELALAGVTPVVLERLPERGTEHRANGLVGQVVPLLHRRGLFERLSGGQAEPRPAPQFVFGGLPLALNRLERNPLYVLGLPQPELVKHLEALVTELGIDIRYGHEVVALGQDEDGVTVRTHGPGGTTSLRARYLVGADGGRSAVRKLAGIGFPGVTHDDTVSRTAHATVPESALDPVTGGLAVAGGIRPFFHHRTERGLFVYAPFPGRVPLISATEWGEKADESVPMSIAELRQSVARVLGVDLPIEAPAEPGDYLLRRVTGGNTRLAERFRDGRILLVGDAAHVHSAIGGPGLNLGLQDVVNLAWKLAAQVRGWAPDGLLDTYDAERRPVSGRVVMHTQAQSALVAPGAEVTALRELFTELLGQENVLQHVADLMTGADIRYDWGDEHPLIGRWAPEVPLQDSFRAARPALLDRTGTLAEAVTGWRDRVDVVTVSPATTPTSLLVRPDGYVAWASDDDQPSAGSLVDALGRWFGPPCRNS